MTDEKATSATGEIDAVSKDEKPKKVKKAKKPAPPFFSFENFRSLGTLILIVFIIRSVVASPYKVPTPSMEPTIKVGDRLLANKLAYNLKIPFTNIPLITWSKPKRGDIIVFKFPGDESIDYVKRVVGIAGDTLEVKDNVLYINGKQMEQTDHNDDRSILSDIKDNKDIKSLYLEDLFGLKHWIMLDTDLQRRSFLNNWGPQDVPENSVFVMGDNRDNSADSRVFRAVPMENVRGKATLVIWSFYSQENSVVPLRVNRFGHWLY